MNYPKNNYSPAYYTITVLAITCMFRLHGTISPEQAGFNKDPLLVITRAHTDAFGNASNILTQRLGQREKQAWVTMMQSARSYIDSIKVSSNLFFRHNSLQESHKKMLESSMAQLERINIELLNTIALAYGIIANALPQTKKEGGTRNLEDIDAQKINFDDLALVVLPIEAQQQVAKDIKESIDALPKTSNKQLQEGAHIVATLGLMFDLTIEAVLRSYHDIENIATQQPAS
jgi:hypothetical protein